MSLGEKLKLLLKENHMTQEDLAEQLEVSRQAVGKWVNDKGMPEVGKLIQISTLFKVSTDYLLLETYEEKHEDVSKEENTAKSGYYVSKEMLDGYLLYHKRNVKQLTAGLCFFLLSNVFNSFENQNPSYSVLYWILITAGTALIIWNFSQPRQYQQIKSEHLVFDGQVYDCFLKQSGRRRKQYTMMMIAGVIIFLAGSEAEHLLTMNFSRELCNAFTWLLDAIWLSLILWAGMLMHADHMIIKNAQQVSRNSPAKKYRWIYTALPATAIAVLIGIITNAWSPYAPILILFCCLLVTTCKLLIENR